MERKVEMKTFRIEYLCPQCSATVDNSKCSAKVEGGKVAYPAACACGWSADLAKRYPATVHEPK